MPINRNFQQLSENYFFSAINRRASQFAEAHPDQRLIRLSIGDVTQPLCPCVVVALEKAAQEMGKVDTFRGYGPEQGYPFLREAIAGYYKKWNISLETEEIFISDGAKSDLGNILDLFSEGTSVLIPDPVYPVYVDASIMGGKKILFLDASEENSFLPLPPAFHTDVIFLCSPNNPTGAVYSKDGLQAWVDYALAEKAVLLFDGAYEAFITDPSLPHSIFEVDGAKKCAIEFCSFSKKAGFTGTRCGYTVIPKELEIDGLSLNHLWLRRQTTKFNGVPYIVQRGAEAVFTPQGEQETTKAIAYYQENARIIRQGLDQLSISYTGGENAPYIWMRCPGRMDSEQYFEFLLEHCAVVGSPGIGFGKNGKYFFRLTAFGAREDVKEAIKRIINCMSL